MRLSQQFRTQKNAYTIIEFLILFCLIALILNTIFFAKNVLKSSNIKSLTAQIKKYDDAIAAFGDKYDALPGDVCDTRNYGITENKTDGNCDNIITDRNEKIISANGEITNFWMHLSQTKMIDENFDGATDEKAKIGETFPISKIGNKIGIVAFGDDGKNFYQIGFKYATQKNIFMSDESLTATESFLFDQKIDDGNPKKGRVVAAGKKFLNGLENSECVKFSNYNEANDKAVCQLRIEIK